MIVFIGWRQCAVPCGHTGSTWQIRLKIRFLWPTRVHKPNGKSIGSAVSARFMAESPYTLQWATLPQNWSFSWGDLDPHLICDSFGQSEPTIQMASRLVQLFSHRWWQRVPILYNGRPFSPKLPLPMGDLDTHLTHGSLDPPDSSTQTASWSVQPFLQGSLVWQTDQPTDRPTDNTTRSVTTDRIYGRCSLIIPLISILISFFQSYSITMPNFVKIGWTVAKIWQFHGFQDGSRPWSWSFKVYILSADRATRVKVCHHANLTYLCNDLNDLHKIYHCKQKFSIWKCIAMKSP